MKQLYAILLASVLLVGIRSKVDAQPCVTSFTGQTVVPAGDWNPAVVPPNLTPTITGTTTNGSNVIAMGTVVGLTVGAGISGPNIPPGTTIVSIAAPNLTLSNAATGSGGPVPYTLTLPPYASNAPPASSGNPAQPGQTATNCTACPSVFSVDLCANEFVNYSMCSGNVYTISLCSSTLPFNSTITVTNAAGTISYAYDDDGCGPVNGLSTITFAPTLPGAVPYRIRILQDPCTVNAALCGTIEIDCSPVPAPPPNDNPCAAVSLPVSTACTFQSATASFATATGGVPVPLLCGASPSGNFGGYDVWFSAVVPASGNLSIQTNLVSATNIAMAAYSAPACTTAYSLIGQRTLGSNTITASNTTGMVVGMRVTGGGIPAGTTVTSIVNATTFTISVPATLTTATAMSMNVWLQLFAPAAGGCNQDAVAGVAPQPFLTFSGLTPGQTVWIRIWPEGVLNNGTFQICAYEPVPPPNDNPCAAVVLPVLPTCTPGTYNTESGTPLAATMTATPVPACGALGGGDVWFRVTMPPSGSMTVNTIAGSLTNMAMAVYQLTGGSICGPGTLTQVTGLCNDNTSVTNLMPTLTWTGTSGAVYYVRVWNLTAAFGTFQICAVPNLPPVNDNPCGAIVLPTNFGCLFTNFSNAFSSVTPSAGGAPGNAWASVPVPVAPCAAATPSGDVWFRSTVPGSGIIQFDTDDATLTDASIAIYTATGTCAAGTLALTQVAGTNGCATGGSAQSAAMPFLNATGLAPGSQIYIRVWRASGTDGNFQLCARNTTSPAGTCDYTLRMSDMGGDGWNGGFVTVCVGAVCTNYTIIGSTGFITFSGNVGVNVVVTYTPAGGFQNQISYQILSSTGGLIYGSPMGPAAGVNTAFQINAACNVPPAPPSDCVGSTELCTSQLVSGNPSNSGGVVDLNAGNDGCLAGERQGLWFRFTAYSTGTLAFGIVPTSSGYTDYDWAVWGPYIGAPTCIPAGAPLRCSWAGTGGSTGMDFTSVDLTEGAGGNAFVRYIDAVAGQSFLLYIDNWSQNGISFNMNWSPAMTADINCLVLPVEFLSFEGKPNQRKVDLTWTTASERNSDYFEVQRSVDGENYEALGQVQAMGNSQNTTAYSFVDETPYSGINYYRLKQVDMSGEAMETERISVLFRRVGMPIELYPNPAKESISVSFETAFEGAAQWRILDMSGRIVERGSTSVSNGTNRVDLSLNRVETGSYMLELLDGAGVPLGNARFMKH
jgi:hypothetical protein